MNPKLCKTLAAVAVMATAVAAHAGPTGTTAPTQVTVMNPSSAPVPVKVAAGTPFLRTFNPSSTAAEVSKMYLDTTWTVPAGKRAVVEYVSARCLSGAQVSINFAFVDPANLGAGGHYLAGASRSFGAQTEFATGHALKLSLSPGATFGAFIHKSDAVSAAACYMHVSGVLTDAS